MDDLDRRTRYAIVGVGWRAQMYLDEIAGRQASRAVLVGIADANPGRAALAALRITERTGHEPEVFEPADLGRRIERLSVDRVIVTTPDATHADYVVAALEAGAHVVVEKPLTTTTDGIRAIADAVRRTGRTVTVTFNYRYSPRNTALKGLIASGALGEVTSVHFEWVLDTAHGADYFRRWHREKENSGGLLIHKSSHHFDLVNWWLADTPSRVFASGGLRFYGADNAARRGLGERPGRGTGAGRDAFALDLRADPALRELYLDQEHHDGYVRDRDVFGPGITIEDNLSLVVDYARGASMTYSLNAHAPWEGYTVAVNGTRGRAELTVVERGAVLLDQDGNAVIDPSARPGGVAADDARPVSERLILQKHFERSVEIPILAGSGGHGGGDERLLDDVFVGVGRDPLGHAADWIDGARSVSVGLAGNRSLATGQAVAIEELGLDALVVRPDREPTRTP